MTIGKREESFTGTGAGTAIEVRGHFHVRVWGTFTGTVKLERSDDEGDNWYVVSKNADGDEAAYTAAMGMAAFEPESGKILYRWNCTALTSGTINTRISQ